MLNDSAVMDTYLGRTVALDPDNPRTWPKALGPKLYRLAARISLPSGWELEDLMQVGMVAALEARRSWIPAKPASFGTWAYMAAQQAMYDAALDAYGAARIPSSTQRLTKERPPKSVSMSGPDGLVREPFVGPGASEAAAEVALLERRLGKPRLAAFAAMAAGWSETEYAALEGVSKQAIDSRKRTARAALALASERSVADRTHHRHEVNGAG